MAPIAYAFAMAAILGNGRLQISVTADPPLPRLNMLENGDFEAAEGDKPLAWTWSTAMPENFRVGWINEGRNGSKCVFLEALSGAMSGYWSQTVRVKPRQRYLLRGWYRLAGGKILIYAHGRSQERQLDARYYAGAGLEASLVPVFLKPEYIVGGLPDKWQAFRLEFGVPSRLTSAIISLGMYFTAGKAWFDDVWLSEAAVDLTIDVQSDAPIAKVEVIDIGGSRPRLVWRTEKLPENLTSFHRLVRGVRADGKFLVRAMTTAGHQAESTYPE